MYLRNYCCVFLFLASLEEALQENPLIDENLFEGDIIGIDSATILQLISQSNYDISNEDISNEDFAADGGQIGHGAPNRHRHNHKLWPDGKVYYKISEDFSSNEINFIQSAFNDFHRYTCIKLIERTDQPDFIKIERRGGTCSSWIGKKGGEQVLRLDSHCLANTTTAKGIAIHEIMHAIGFFHEQSRPDRDDYVEIFEDNVIHESMKENFKKYGLDILQNLHTKYDYESIMHYGTTDFASDGKETIKPRDPEVRIGQRKGLSQIDIREINLLYNCEIVGPVTVPKVASKIEICWGTRFMTDQGSFRVDSWNDCIQRCNQNSVCEAITFYDDKAYTNENCFLFNAATNYNTEYDPDLRYGTWKKNRNSFHCQQHSKFRWGTHYIKHYSKRSASEPNECIKRCKQDNSCDAISFNSNTSNENCYFFNARASGYDSKLDPTNKWGSWKKNEISSKLIKSSKTIQWRRRLKTHYDHRSAKNSILCMKLCDEDSRCHAMSFDRRVESARNNNCYFFNSEDHFTSESAEEHWGTWIKPTVPSSTKSTTVKTSSLSCQFLGGTCKQTDGTCMEDGKKSVFYDYGCQKRHFPSRGTADEYCCVPAKKREYSCQVLGGTCKQTDGTCMEDGKKSVFYDYGCRKRYFPSRGTADEYCCVPGNRG